MLLKIRIKEAYGVNTEMVLCQDEDCLVMSSQIGTSEILLGQVNKGKNYYVELSFAKSIIQMSEFFTCPHFAIEISMIKIDEASKMVTAQSSSSASSKSIDFDS